MKRLFSLIAMLAVVALAGCKKDDSAIVDVTDDPNLDDTIEVVEFADSNFKAALIESGFDTNRDGEITTDEALLVTEIVVTGKKIKSLDGLDAFENLEVLQCSDTYLSEITQFNNTKLREIVCNGTEVTFLDVCKCSELTTLYADSVISIFVYDDAQKSKITKFGYASGYVYVVGSEPYVFSDDNFRLALLNDKNSIDLDNNGVISQGEVRVATKVDISIDAMASVSKSLLIDATRAAETKAGAGFVKNVNLSEFVSLKEFYCDGNESLVYVDLSNCPKVETVSASSVKVVLLSLVQYANETFMDMISEATSDSVEIVKVSDGVTLNSSINSYLLKNFDTDEDGLISYGEAAAATTLSLSNNGSVTSGDVDAALIYMPGLETLTLSSCTALTQTISMSNNGLLKTLTLTGNADVTSLDLSANGLLESININTTGISALDLTAATQLKTLNVKSTAITELDLSGNPNFKTLTATDLPLTKVVLSGVSGSVFNTIHRAINSNEISAASLVSMTAEELTDGATETTPVVLAELSNRVEVSGFANLAELSVPQAAAIFASQPQADNYIATGVWSVGAAADNVALDGSKYMSFADEVVAEYFGAELTLDAATETTSIDLSQSEAPSEVASFSELKYFMGVEELNLTGCSQITSLDLTPNAVVNSVIAPSVTLVVVSQGVYDSGCCDSWALADGAKITMAEVSEDDALSFSDAAFEAALIASGVDADASGAITLAEAQATTAIDLTECANKADVVKTTELKYFTALESLNLTGCAGIASIDLSTNVKLTALNITDTAIEVLDISAATGLLFEGVEGAAGKLTKLVLNSTQRSQEAVEDVDMTMWSALLKQDGNDPSAPIADTYIYMYSDGVTTQLYPNLTKPLSVSDELKAELIASGVDSDSDGSVTYDEADTFTGTITSTLAEVVDYMSFFPNVTGLVLSAADVTALDLSTNVSITSLTLTGSGVTALDVTPLTAAPAIVGSEVVEVKMTSAQVTAAGDLDDYLAGVNEDAAITVGSSTYWVAGCIEFKTAAIKSVFDSESFMGSDSSFIKVATVEAIETISITDATIAATITNDINDDLVYFTGLTSLTITEATNAEFTELDVTYNTALIYLIVTNAKQTTDATIHNGYLANIIGLTQLTAIKEVSLNYTAVESLKFDVNNSNLTKIACLSCSNLASVDLEGCTSAITVLNINNTADVISFNFKGATGLKNFKRNSEIQDVDFSDCAADLYYDSVNAKATGTLRIREDQWNGGVLYVGITTAKSWCSDALSSTGTIEVVDANKNILFTGTSAGISSVTLQTESLWKSLGLESGASTPTALEGYTSVSISDATDIVDATLASDLANFTALESLTLTNCSSEAFTTISLDNIATVTALDVTGSGVTTVDISAAAATCSLAVDANSLKLLYVSPDQYGAAGENAATYEAMMSTEEDVYIYTRVNTDGTVTDEMVFPDPNTPIEFADAQFKTDAESSMDDDSISLSDAADYAGSLETSAYKLADLASFPNITGLTLTSSDVDGLDLSGNTKITALNIDETSITTLDLTMLETLPTAEDISAAGVTSLYITSAQAATIVSMSDYAAKFDSAVVIYADGTQVYPVIYEFKSAEFKEAFTTLYPDVTLTESELSSVTVVDLSDAENIGSITSLEDLAIFTSLERLSVNGASACSTIDITANTVLTEIDIAGTAITSLDLTSCISTSVDVNSGTLTTLKISESATVSDYTAALADDGFIYAGTNVYDKSGELATSSVIIFQDATFEAAVLTALGKETGDTVTPEEALDVETISIATSADLTDNINTDLANFTGLKSLTLSACTSTGFTSLDLTQNAVLEYLYVYESTNLATITGLSDLENLYYINAGKTALTEIVLGEKNTKMQSLFAIAATSLVSVDLSGSQWTWNGVDSVMVNFNNITGLNSITLTGATGIKTIKISAALETLDAQTCDDSFVINGLTTDCITSSFIVNETQYSNKKSTYVGYLAGGAVMCVVDSDGQTLYEVDDTGAYNVTLTAPSLITALGEKVDAEGNISSTDIAATTSLVIAGDEYATSSSLNADLANFTALETLEISGCSGSGFTSLDLTNNTAITALTLTDNTNLTSLDITSLTALPTLSANTVTSLTVSEAQVTAITDMASFAAGLAEGAKIYQSGVEEEIYPVEVFYTLSCEAVIGSAEVSDLVVEGQISDSKIAGVTTLTLDGSALLTGLNEDLKVLTSITSLTVTNATDTEFTMLDITKLTDIESVTLTGSAYIAGIRVAESLIGETTTVADIYGWIAATEGAYVEAESETGTITRYDDASGEASITFSDPTFEAAVLAALSKETGDKVTPAEALTVTTLAISDATSVTNAINQDLKNFTALTSFTLTEATDEAFTELDVTYNTALIYLTVTNAQQTTDTTIHNGSLAKVTGLTQLTEIKEVSLNYTAVESIKFGVNNSNLTKIACLSCNNLASVDLEGCTGEIGTLNLNYTADEISFNFKGATGLKNFKRRPTTVQDVDFSDCAADLFYDSVNSKATGTLRINEDQWNGGVLMVQSAEKSWCNDALSGNGTLEVVDADKIVLFTGNKSSEITANLQTASLVSALGYSSASVAATTLNAVESVAIDEAVDITDLSIARDLAYFTGLTSLAITNCTSLDFTELALVNNTSVSSVDLTGSESVGSVDITNAATGCVVTAPSQLTSLYVSEAQSTDDAIESNKAAIVEGGKIYTRTVDIESGDVTDEVIYTGVAAGGGDVVETVTITTSALKEAIGEANFSDYTNGIMTADDAAEVTSITIADGSTITDTINADLVYLTGLTTLSITGCTNAGFTELDVTNNVSLKTLTAINSSYGGYLATITGLEGLTKLKTFTVDKSAITSIVFGSANTELTTISAIDCDSLTSVVLDGCIASITTCNFNNIDNMPTISLVGTTGLSKIKAKYDIANIDISDCASTFTFDAFGKTTGNITESLTVSEDQFSSSSNTSFTTTTCLAAGATLTVVDADKNVLYVYTNNGGTIELTTDNVTEP